MLVISEENVRDVKSLSNANPAAMMRVVGWLDGNFEELNGALNHLDPDPTDHNFNTRFHYRRGFVAAIDSIKHLFANPDEAIQQEEEKKLEDANAF